VRLAGVFGDRMVLQRDRPIAVWGRADPGEAVKVSFHGATATATADAEGRWKVVFGPFLASGDREMVVEGKNRVAILAAVGDLWLCSGQSNMGFPLRAAADAEKELADAADPRLRLYTVPARVAGEPQEEVAGQWQVCAPDTARDFSAVAYFFGRCLREHEGIPVGLVHASWGGTPAESWVRPRALADHPHLRPILAAWDEAMAAAPRGKTEFEAALAAWQVQAEAARKAGLPSPRRPAPPLGPDHPFRPGALFHGMVAPLAPMSFAGVIWYQGESNAGRAEQYRTLFPALIADWRAAFDRPHLPFLFVQLASFGPVVAEPGESAWAELRDAQRLALQLPATAMAVAVDIGDPADIHPRNKREVGRRLALAARALRGEDVVGSGPLYESHARDGERIVVRFRHAAGLAARDGDPLLGFTVAGPDRRFHRAHAVVAGDTVTVWHPRVNDPQAVRYAWADSPVCNLVNGAGLPASPFRTDDWPGVTAGRR
jgi:sialate O-acetylesterase